MMGCSVVSFSQPRKTMQTPGIPDLKIYFKDHTWWHEVKTEGGRQSADQKAFQAVAEAAGERYVLGGVEAAVQILRELEIKVE